MDAALIEREDHQHSVIPRPFMFRYADERTASSSIPGSYDPNQKVWCVTRDGQTMPIVEAADAAALEIQTKTKVLQEADDEVDTLVQLRTKTFQNEEVDDDQHVLAALLEITTKTDAQVESDDHSTF